MGLFDFLIEDDFVLVSSRTEPEYTHWGHGEPDNDGEQDCAVLNSEGYWDDVDCLTSLWSICEMRYAM